MSRAIHQAVPPIGPYGADSERDSGQEVSGSRVVARGDSAERLAPGDEVLAPVRGFIDLSVKMPMRAAIGPWRDDHGLVGRGCQRLERSAARPLPVADGGP